MLEIEMQFEVDETGRTPSVGALEEHLRKTLPSGNVELTDARVRQSRGVAEVAMVMSASVVILGQGASLLEGLTKVVKAAREFGTECRKTWIEFRGRKIDPTAVTEEELKAIADEASG